MSRQGVESYSTSLFLFEVEMRIYKINGAPFDLCRADRRYNHYSSFPWFLSRSWIKRYEFQEFIDDNFDKEQGENYHLYHILNNKKPTFLYHATHLGDYLEIYPSKESMTMLLLKYPVILKYHSLYA